MTDCDLANELRAISRELDAMLSAEEDAAVELDRRFAEEHDSIEQLFRSVQAAKLSGRWRNTYFNVFDVLGRPRLEVAHSSFLAWILNPYEAHGFGDAFLREFMRRTIGEPPSTVNVSVSREYRCGDLRFDVNVKGEGWCLVVENKIDDPPREGQTREYQEYCSKLRCRGEQAWLVYVTPTRRPPGQVPWMSYREVRLILESLTPDASAATVVEQFCDHVISELEA